MIKNKMGLMTGLLFAASMASTTSFARVRMVDGIDPDSVVQSIEMKGAAGYDVTAGIISDPTDSGDPQFGTNSLVIFETKGAANYMAVNTKDLALDTQTQPQLSVNKSQSLLVSQNNENYPSRDQWNRTLTVSYVNGKYAISGFTFSSYDKLDPNAADTCDYNLLTGKGILNGKKVALKTKPISLEKPLAAVFETKLYDCKGW